MIYYPALGVDRLHTAEQRSIPGSTTAFTIQVYKLSAENYDPRKKFFIKCENAHKCISVYIVHMEIWAVCDKSYKLYEKT